MFRSGNLQVSKAINITGPCPYGCKTKTGEKEQVTAKYMPPKKRVA